jgi:hypothetical protein
MYEKDTKDIIILHTNVLIFLIGLSVFIGLTIHFQYNLFQDFEILLLISIILFGIVFLIHLYRLIHYYCSIQQPSLIRYFTPIQERQRHRQQIIQSGVSV